MDGLGDLLAALFDAFAEPAVATGVALLTDDGRDADAGRAHGRVLTAPGRALGVNDV